MRVALAGVLLLGLVAINHALTPLRPPVKRSFPKANSTQVMFKVTLAL